jgi:arsenate reductase
MTVTIYHNNRCSKSRQVLQILNDRDLNPTEIYYLETPPDFSTLEELISMLTLKSARQLMRKNENIYKELNLDDPDLDEKSLITAMIENPILIERPIVVNNGKARIGRPPENILEIL